MRRLSLACALGVTLAIAGISQGIASAAGPAEVIVLSTLHQLHAQTNGYSFADLSEVIEQLHPDIIAVELTAADLESRREQSTKQEYQRVVFPLLDKHNYEVVPLEPPQPLYDELVSLFRKAQKDLSEQNPVGAETFNLYMDSLFEMLGERWVSPGAVNSRATDILFESKHRFQSALFGPEEAQAWQGWNQHFLQQILQTADANPDKRILVLVGAEHSYWLRAHLANSEVILLDTQPMLADRKKGARSDF
jgi:hypothetical protein